jgi:hypothetical protein
VNELAFLITKSVIVVILTLMAMQTVRHVRGHAPGLREAGLGKVEMALLYLGTMLFALFVMGFVLYVCVSSG